MARSIRSKRGMALRRAKRERYAKKELIRLNKMLGLPNEEDKIEVDIEMTADGDEKKGLSSKDFKLLRNIVKDGSDSEDSNIEKELDEVAVMTSNKFLRKKSNALLDDKNVGNGDSTATAFTVDEIRKLNQFDSSKLVDEHGSYPVWMNQRKIRALSKANRIMKKKKLKRLAHVAKKRPFNPRESMVSEDEGERNDENVVEDVAMETDEVATKTTSASPKGKGKRGRKTPAKAKNAKQPQKEKIEETTEDKEKDVETIDLSD